MAIERLDVVEVSRLAVRQGITATLASDKLTWERLLWGAHEALPGPSCGKAGKGRCQRREAHAGPHVSALQSPAATGLASLLSWTDDECLPEGEGEPRLGGAVDLIEKTLSDLLAAERLLRSYAHEGAADLALRAHKEASAALLLVSPSEDAR